MKEFLPVAAFPASQTQYAIEQLQAVMPLPLTPLQNGWHWSTLGHSDS